MVMPVPPPSLFQLLPPLPLPIPSFGLADLLGMYGLGNVSPGEGLTLGEGKALGEGIDADFAGVLDFTFALGNGFALGVSPGLALGINPAEPIRAGADDGIGDFAVIGLVIMLYSSGFSALTSFAALGGKVILICGAALPFAAFKSSAHEPRSSGFFAAAFNSVAES